MPGKSKFFIIIILTLALLCCIVFIYKVVIKNNDREDFSTHIFYVSPEGSDNNPGSFEGPWLTPAGALEHIRYLIDGQTVIIIFFREGIYYIDQSTRNVIDGYDNQNGMIKLAAYPGEYPQIITISTYTGDIKKHPPARNGITYRLGQ